jgi:hypothetical protein
LLASATATSLKGRRARSCVSQGYFSGFCLARRNTARAPTTRMRLRYWSPCLEIGPSFCLPPVESCSGTSPIQAAKSRPDRKTDGSATVAAIAVAPMTPMPGMVSSRLLASFEQRGQAYVIDAGGRLIAHPHASLILSNSDMTQLAQVQAARAWATSCAGCRSGIRTELQEAQDLQGHKVLSAYAQVYPLGWLVFVELPVEEANALAQ